MRTPLLCINIGRDRRTTQIVMKQSRERLTLGITREREGDMPHDIKRLSHATRSGPKVQTLPLSSRLHLAQARSRSQRIRAPYPPPHCFSGYVFAQLIRVRTCQESTSGED